MESEAHSQPEPWRDADPIAPYDGIDDLESMFDAACDALDRMRAQVRSELGLSAVECLVVRLLARQPLTIGELTRRTSAGRSSISMAVSRLEKRGMVVRPSRSRRAPIDLADSTRHSYHAACRAPARAALEDWATEQDPTAVDAATALFTRIGSHVEDARTARRTRSAIAVLHDALLRGDVRGCVDTARSLVHDGAIAPAYTALLQAHDRIAATRARRAATPADDHAAHLTALDAAERLHRLGKPAKRARRSALVLPVNAEEADLGTRLAAYELDRAGWDVHVLPSGLTDASILSLHANLGTELLVLGVADAEAAPTAIDLASTLGPLLPVAAFGSALASEVLGSRFAATGASVHGTLQGLVADIDTRRRPVDDRQR